LLDKKCAVGGYHQSDSLRCLIVAFLWHEKTKNMREFWKRCGRKRPPNKSNPQQKTANADAQALPTPHVLPEKPHDGPKAALRLQSIGFRPGLFIRQAWRNTVVALYSVMIAGPRYILPILTEDLGMTCVRWRFPSKVDGGRSRHQLSLFFPNLQSQSFSGEATRPRIYCNDLHVALRAAVAVGATLFVLGMKSSASASHKPS